MTIAASLPFLMQRQMLAGRSGTGLKSKDLFIGRRLAKCCSYGTVRDYLWAIPQNDMDLNKNLVQNPGW